MVSREVAEAEMERFFNRHDLRLRPDHYDEATRKLWQSQYELLIEEIMRGQLVVSEDGLLSYTPYTQSVKGPLNFKELSYEFLEESDKYSKEGMLKQNRMLLAYLTGNAGNPAMFYHMNKRDSLVTSAILIITQGESRPL